MLVVGGGEVAARKVRLLREAGALVDVVARELSGPGLTEDSVRWLATDFEEVQLEGAILVVAATDDTALNDRVSVAARRRSQLCNVVDDAARSGFIVPAIVDRSPLVIAVSTGGVAPVLARLARERIESLFDESWGAVARMLEDWRGSIRRALPEVGARRRFYERVLRGSIARLVKAGRVAAAEAEMRIALEDRQHGEPGSVVLVGAGPGDPGLLTLNALRALQEADVILHDRLVSDEILNLARRDAERIPVGKAAGVHSVPQSSINQLLVEHASAGRRVVRLKGGDPFVFGRGGEELEELARCGIRFEVVPGITAATACGAYAGIPLTHRDHAQSVTLVTAHCGDSVDKLDWGSLAEPNQTVAFYMGVAALGRIAKKLMAHGRLANTPAAVIENGSRPDQKVTLSTLSRLPDLAQQGTIRTPALLVVGEVAALADSLHWFGQPPSRYDGCQAVQFIGRRIVDPTRQAEAIDAAGEAQPGCQDRGVGVIDRPAVEIRRDREAVARRA